MGYSRQQKEDNHARIVTIAAHRFREYGLDGLGVAGLMKEAGLTHGGFYAHFASREALVAEALDCAFEQDEERLMRAMAAREGPVLEKFLDIYLSAEHRDNPGQGCTLASIAPEAARRDDAIKSLFDRQIERYVTALTGQSGLGRDTVLAVIGAAVGALSLSRTVADRALSDDILRGTRAAMLAMIVVAGAGQP